MTNVYIIEKALKTRNNKGLVMDKETYAFIIDKTFSSLPKAIRHIINDKSFYEKEPRNINIDDAKKAVNKSSVLNWYTCTFATVLHNGMVKYYSYRITKSKVY